MAENRSVGVRVRPNSQDFIRLLKADLKTKQATFWVDVRAKTGQATGDVRKWAATDLKQITGFVRVRANTGEASRDVAEWRRRQSTTKTIVNVGADTSQAVRQIAQLQALARDITVKVKADPSGGRTAVERAAKQSVKNIPDAGDSKRRLARNLDDFAAQIDIGGARMAKSMADNLQKVLKNKKLQIDADTTPARKSFRELLDKFGGAQLEVEVDADTTKAEGRTAELKRNVELRNIKLEADIDLRRARTELAQLRLKEKLNKIDLEVNVKKNSAEGIFKQIGDIEKRFGNLTVLRSLDLGPLTLGKPSGLIGTLASITALAGAVPGAVAGLSALSDTLVRLGGAAALAPGAIGALAASLGTLSVGSIGVSDTFSALFGMWTEGTSKTNAYRNSVEEEAKAQRGVATARREALGELRDLNQELRGGVLNEAQALLDVQKARDRYAQGGFDNETDRLQALLDVKKAELNVDEVRERNLRTQQKVNEASVKGVENSDRVQDALAGLAQAQNNGTAATSKYNDMLEQLSPNARDYIETIAGMKDELLGFKNELQDITFLGTGPAFKQLFQNLGPTVESGMKDIAKGLNQNLLEVFDTLGSADGKSIIERILGGTAETQKAITNLINPLIKGIGTLVAAGSEKLPQVVNLFTNLAERFATFIDKADKDGSLDTFFDKGIKAAGDLAETGINLIKIINDLSKAFGGDVIGSLSEATGKLHEFLASAEGQKKLNELMQKAKEIWADWAPVLEKLPGVFVAVSDAAKTLLDAIMPLINGIVGFMKENPTLVSGFITGWLGAKVLTGVFSPLIGLFGTAFKLGEKLFQLLGKIPAVAKTLGYLKNVLPGGGGILTGPGTTAATGAAGGIGALATGAAGAGLAAVGVNAFRGYGLSRDSGAGVFQSVSTGGAAATLEFIAPGPLGLLAPDLLASLSKSDADEAVKNQFRDALYKKFMDNIATEGAAEKFYGPGASVGMSREDLEANLRNAGSPFPGFLAGGMHTGYTPWGAKQGKMAELHGGEYVEPKHVVDYYGQPAMEAIHQKRIPKQFLGSFDGGGPTLVYDPNTGQMVPVGSAIGHGQNPLQGSPGIIDTVANAGAGIGSAFANTATSAVPGVGTGPLPGPAAGAPALTAPGGFGGSFGNSFLGGIGIPGLTPTSAGTGGPGWGPGGPPIGLGGGDGFDMRKMGFGPGPVGSGPNDWMQFAGSTLGKFGSSFITTLAGGLLDGLGLGGVSSYLQQAGGIAGQFLDNKGKAQGEGADQTNADVSGLLDTYGGIPGNPAYPGIPGMPGVFDPSTGSAVGGGQGLQVNTARGKSIIQSLFPWATNIGGVRADKLKWHPSGLALDVMTDPGHGNNEAPSPEGLARGNQLYAWLNANKQALGIDYLLWQEKDHFNHIHVNFAPSGFGAGNGPAALPTTSAPGPVTGPGAKPGAWGNAPGGTGTLSTKKPPMTTAPNTGFPVGTTSLPPRPTGYTEGPAKGTPFQYRPDGSIIGYKDAKPPKPASGTPGLQYGPPTGGFMRGGLVRDRGGLLPTGTSLVHNFTGKPELVLNGPQAQYVGSFLPGGAIPTGAIIPPPKPWQPPNAQIIPKKPITATPRPTPPPVASPPPLPPAAPPIATPPAPATPGIAAPAGQGPNAAPIAQSDRPATGVGPGEDGDHLNPALSKGITSGFAAAGNAAAAAASFGLGGMGGGAIGGGIAGLFGQAGKIAKNIANVGASFLVGNVTGGTTPNPYGVTQRGSVPTGGTKVVDASNNQYGDVYTNDLDSYFSRVDRRNAQQAQANLGRWGKA